MPWLVRLENVEGAVLAEVADKSGLLWEVFPDHEDRSFPYLRFVDPFDETIFNSMQMAAFLPEWRRLRGLAPREDVAKILRDVEQLAQRCEEESLFLRFIGD